MSRRWFWPLAFLIAAVVGTAAVVLPWRSDVPQAVERASPTDERPGVGCRGRIEPEDGVIVVAAPYFAGRPSLVSELRVKEGDSVEAGQVLAILDGWRSLEKALRQSEADIEVARTRLVQTQAGAKLADLDALRIDIARWESEYEIADSDYRRFQKLHENAIVPAIDLDQKRLAVDRAKRTLDAAKERLKSLEDVRKEDVDVRSAEKAAATAQAERANAELERMVVRAPAKGNVLKVYAHPGEEVGSAGILELGKTDRMYVIAEVYESDIHRIHAGQKASVSGPMLQEKLSGKVTQIGSEVSRSELLPLDPAAFADTRVVKVKIQLENGDRVAALIYGKVDVVIHP
jgi:HlyD family secretion protein